jgi:hypothetical protein
VALSLREGVDSGESVALRGGESMAFQDCKGVALCDVVLQARAGIGNRCKALG